jgi:hypothetical protein
MAGLVGVPSAEAAYVVAAWGSWLLPLAAYEIVERFAKRRPVIAVAAPTPSPSAAPAPN